MFYTVYKTTNLINGKFYIGTHKTADPNDSYLGSGTLLKKAIDKYGVSSFKKEVLFVFDNPEAMFAKEAEIVTEEFLAENNTYNLKLGGFGGFDWINSRALNVNNGVNVRLTSAAAREIAESVSRRRREDPEYDRWFRDIQTAKLRINKAPFAGKRHTEETKQKMSRAASQRLGDRTSQFGSMWITDGADNKKIRRGDPIPEGWSPGRKCLAPPHDDPESR